MLSSWKESVEKFTWKPYVSIHSPIFSVLTSTYWVDFRTGNLAHGIFCKVAIRCNASCFCDNGGKPSLFALALAGLALAGLALAGSALVDNVAREATADGQTCY